MKFRTLYSTVEKDKQKIKNLFFPHYDNSQSRLKASSVFLWIYRKQQAPHLNIFAHIESQLTLYINWQCHIIY